MIGANASGGEGDGLADVRRRLGRAGLDLLGGHADGLGRQVDLVEAAAVVEQRLDPLRTDGLEHASDGGVDISRRAATLVKEGLEGGLEIGVGKQEAAHGLLDAAFSDQGKPESLRNGGVARPEPVHQGAVDDGRNSQAHEPGVGVETRPDAPDAPEEMRRGGR